MYKFQSHSEWKHSGLLIHTVLLILPSCKFVTILIILFPVGMWTNFGNLICGSIVIKFQSLSECKHSILLIPMLLLILLSCNLVTILTIMIPVGMWRNMTCGSGVIKFQSLSERKHSVLLIPMLLLILPSFNFVPILISLFELAIQKNVGNLICESRVIKFQSLSECKHGSTVLPLYY